MKPRYAVMATAVPTIWGFGFAISKLGLSEIPPMFLMGMRYTLAALVLVWFVRPPFGRMREVFVAAAISGALTYALVFTGLRDMNASTAILVIQLQVPFLAILGVILLKEKLGPRVIIGMTGAFAGVALIAGTPEVRDSLIPMFIVVAGGLVWALGQVMIRRIGDIGGMRLLAWVAVFAAPQLFIASFLFEEGQFEGLAAAGWVEWGVILYLGLIMTAFAYTMWYHVLAHCEVSKAAPYLLVNPISAVVGGVLILGEKLTPMTAVGGIIVLVGIAVMTIEGGTWRRMWGRRGPAV